MKKTLLAVALGMLAVLLVVPAHHTMAAHDDDDDDDHGRGRGDPHVDVQAILSAHHQELSFDIAPGASASFALPKTQWPIRIDVSFSLLNGGTQTPSEIMSALVNQDPQSSKITWVGTNNDASQQAGTTLPTGSNPVIARICGGGCPTTNASLEVNSDATLPGTLKLSVNSATVTSQGHFKVSLWY
ncbi:MAG: hypothetical protein HYX72_11130 [Acidobacteria bacterium]|nr:hypothetical protein [Acidobacteriota bacterium]